MAKTTKSKVQTNNPGILVLQWLTYAFWGWTVLALAWLTTISVGFYINKDTYSGGESETIAYSLAAVIVLFAISLLCDVFYSRVEPKEKTGAATLIMIIHAVLFALFGIGALIIAVFAVVRLLIGDNTGSPYGDSGAQTMLVTGLIITVVYGATLLRTLRPFKLKYSALMYWVFMAVVSVSVTVLGIAGPTLYASQTRDDRLIERGLGGVSEAVRNYSENNNKLPASLADLGTLYGDAKTLVDRNLVEYNPGAVVDAPKDAPKDDIIARPQVVPSFNYELCVTYKEKKGGVASYHQMDSTSPNTYYHEAGRVCYDLTTSYQGKYY